jgi:dTDP-4-amino-4,6-dideoxygalactose transaminase
VSLPKAIHELEYNHGAIYGPEEEAAMLEALRASAPSCGAQVKRFEEAFASYCEASHGLAVSSATAGLHLAMIAANIGPGDEVITTPLSWISTANAAALCGATVVFADVDPRTLNIDPASVADLVTDRTKAILTVHLYGQCCDMDPLIEVAKRRGITIVEDCAHSAGASYKGHPAGSLGDIGVFSFHQQKNMATLGEGGMITTSDPRLFERMLSYRSLCCRSYDPKGKYVAMDEAARPMGKQYWYLDFDGIGYNYRMTDVQAAVGLEQLKKLDAFNERRIEVAREYDRGLAGVRGITLPYTAKENRHVFHAYCIQLEPDFALAKEDFMWRMYTEKRVKVWSHYMPIHLTTAYRALGHSDGECPVAEAAFQKYVSLPIHPRLTKDGLDYVIESVKDLA